MSANYKIIEQIGEGAYGKVYRAVNLENGEDVALKQVRHSGRGIECLFETAMVASLKHPNLSSARYIFSTPTHLNIVQDLAQSDMSEPHQKISEVNEDERLRITTRWCFSVAQVVFYLHRLGIIHGDIKSGNVLYFDRNDIRLTDFNLSVKMWSLNDRFKRSVGTCGCAPPEVLLGKDWGMKVDIWALGCLFYKFVFGKALFPRQSKENGRKKLKEKYYKSIVYWLNGGTRERGIEYPQVDEKWNNGKYHLIRDLILKMLQFNEGDRISMIDVLHHPFFENMTKTPIYLLETNYKPFDRVRNEKVSSEIRRVLYHTQHLLKQSLENTHDLALGIYQRIFSFIPISTKKDKLNVYMVTVCWLATKIVTNKTITLTDRYPIQKIVKCEREVCHYLSYIFPLIKSHTLVVFQTSPSRPSRSLL